MKQAHASEITQRRLLVLERYCVGLAKGDIWLSGDQTIKITGLTRKIDFANGASMNQQDNEGSGYLPWPIVTYVDEEGRTDFIGAPAFKFMVPVSRGAGEYWDPAEEMQKIQLEEKKKKEKEDDRAAARAGFKGSQGRP